MEDSFGKVITWILAKHISLDLFADMVKRLMSDPILDMLGDTRSVQIRCPYTKWHVHQPLHLSSDSLRHEAFRAALEAHRPFEILRTRRRAEIVLAAALIANSHISKDAAHGLYILPHGIFGDLSPILDEISDGPNNGRISFIIWQPPTHHINIPNLTHTPA